MKNIEWSHKYELGQEDIDLEHHLFVNLINRLSKELGHFSDPERNKRQLNELITYTKFHFASEENMMLRYEYPEFTEHKAEHFDLLEELAFRFSKVDLATSDETIRELIDFLQRWFIKHTLEVDRRFTDYLQERDSLGN